MSTNDITGDALRSKATSEKYRENFDHIFRPLCTDCGKRICNHKEPAKSGSNLMEDQKSDNDDR